MQYCFGAYSFDPARYDLRQAGTPVPLRPQACELLAYLLRHRDRVVPKEELLAQVWPGQYVGDGVLHACVLAVRTALHDTGGTPALLHTVRGRGYRFVAPVEEREQVLPAAQERSAGLALEEASALAPPRTPPPARTTAATDHASPNTPPTDGEYKLVSILCCGLAAAPALVARLGAEGLYRLLQTVVELAQEVLQPYVGTLLLPTSEEITAVFGAPVAQEDHAQRAVLAALELHQRLRQHPALRAQLVGEGLAMRMGVHSGLVVVGELGQDAQRVATVVGVPSQVARRLQEQAVPGTILLSATTYHLVQAEVRAAPCGTLAIDGSPTPMPVYTVQGLLRREAGVRGCGARVRSPFVGRARELALLHDRLAAAGAGQGQVVGLVGEPGMGKSRLLVEFCRSVPAHQVTAYVGQCLSYGSATPYLPVCDLLRASCGITPADSVDTLIEKVRGGLQAVGMAPDAGAPYVLSLLGVEAGTAQLTGMSPEALKATTFETLRQLLLRRSQQHPLLLAVEDLHWSDPTSAEFFASLVERLPGAALLFLGTYRPGYRPAWLEKSYATQLPVPPLSAPDSVQLLRAVLQTETIPVPLTQVLLTKAQGNPFFLEELAQALMEQGGMGDETHDHSPVPTPALRALQLPPTVHGVLAARIDSLAHEAKYLLQCAAVIGIEVPVPLLQAITEWPEARLQQGLAHLQAIEFLYETRVMPACHYTFKHALTQEVAYQSVLRSTRQQYHQRIAQVLEQQCPEMSETQPELLAHHYTEAGLRAQAIPYWQRAGQRAFQGSANLEAVAHLTKGLEVLATLPDTPERAQQELTLSITLGLALRVTRGFAAPEVAATYHRARELCRQVGETPQLFPVLGGLVLFYNNRGEFQTARELAEQMLNLAQRVHDPARLVNAHITLGNALFFLDELVTACTHLEQGIARYLEQGIARYQPLQDRSHGLSNLTHVGVHGLSRLAQILWMLGYPDQALQRSQEALTLAQELSYPFSLATALLFAATLHRHRREGHRAYEQSEAALVLSGEQGFSLRLAQATILQGWALVEQGQGQAGMAQIRQGLAGRQASGVATAGYLDLLAEACWKTGQIEEGLWAIAEALALRDSSGSRGGAELYRLKGELLLRTGHDATEAEERFQHALATARSQQAKSWELRAAMSLSRLWQQQGKCQEAYDLLAPVYGWFTEGFDTADLQDAQALLAELVG